MNAPLKIFLMTKNDVAFIEDWVKYHGHLFGFQNLYLIDGSTDSRVLSVYDKYKPTGLNVVSSKANLNQLADVITQVMHQFKGQDSFLIKLDTDEFLAYKPALTSATLSNSDIGSLFNYLPVTGQKYKAAYTVRSVPQQHSFERPCTELTTFSPIELSDRKSFFHSDSFVSVDLGCHRGESRQDHGYLPTGLTTVHYHSINIEDTMNRARQVLISHNYISQTDNEAVSIQKLEALLHRSKRKTPQGVHTELFSVHRVVMYLEYLLGEPSPATLEYRAFNTFLRDTSRSGETIEVSLVRDTLQRLDE